MTLYSACLRPRFGAHMLSVSLLGQKPIKIWALREKNKSNRTCLGWTWFMGQFWTSKTLKEHPEKSMEAWWGPYRGGYVEPCRGYVGSKADQNLSPSRRAQIFGVFLPENRFQRPHGTLLQLRFQNYHQSSTSLRQRMLEAFRLDCHVNSAAAALSLGYGLTNFLYDLWSTNFLRSSLKSFWSKPERASSTSSRKLESFCLNLKSSTALALEELPCK